MKEKEFRERIARIQRIKNLEEVMNEDFKQNNLSEIKPAVYDVKKTIDDFIKREKEVEDEER